MRIARITFIVILLAVSAAFNAHAQALHEGDFVGSSGDESKRVTKDILNKINELNEQIRKGPPQFSMSGQVEATSGNQYTVNGESFSVNSDTIIFGELKGGVNATVRGILVPGQPKVARQIVVQTVQSGAHSTNLRSYSESEDLSRSGR